MEQEQAQEPEHKPAKVPAHKAVKETSLMQGLLRALPLQRKVWKDRVTWQMRLRAEVLKQIIWKCHNNPVKSVVKQVPKQPARQVTDRLEQKPLEQVILERKMPQQQMQERKAPERPQVEQ